MNKYANARTTVIALLGMVVMGFVVGGFVISLDYQRAATTSTLLNANDTASFIPPPNRMSDLVQRSDLIVIGVTQSVLQESAFGGYDISGNVIQSTDGSSVPLTDFNINVEQVIYSKDAPQPSTLTLRMIGHVSDVTNSVNDSTAYFPMSQVGERRLFFLSKNPDGTYGLFYGPWSRLIIDTPTVAVSSGEKTPVRLGEREYNLSDFLSEVKKQILQRHN